ncbi:hypothetical protein ASD65_05610 [Microbacterium sp. Root61]|uniref:GNAT family N-acetyltransferase n=1 Tax=Microbacterium sp. Root61 TaxID=1736570 RepID=UPI0006FBBE6E|nr:GNAT family N-acetyltransferase [Microbacterium sp. Root61]KRA23954.1 hypothetical protein ASD65_05610 [Microbacterium sp. Root61]
MQHSPVLDVGLATPADVPGILDVQEENLPENGGSLSARFTPEWFAQAIANETLIVARCDDHIAGYVAFTSRDAQSHVPIIQAMLRAEPHPDAYVHGPICVAKADRRRGVAALLFAAQREVMDHAAVCAFIRQDNEASRAAHRRMGMRETALFEHDGVTYVLVEASATT